MPNNRWIYEGLFRKYISYGKWYCDSVINYWTLKINKRRTENGENSYRGI